MFCFYPMTKRREAHANWYATPFDERNEMMREHGKSGRTFAGKVVQLITGSTGLDDFEWGVTLFAVTPEVVKDVVYTMRFDKGSALYGEFGRFYVGYLASSTTSSTGCVAVTGGQAARAAGRHRDRRSTRRRRVRRSRSASNRASSGSPSGAELDAAAGSVVVDVAVVVEQLRCTRRSRPAVDVRCR